jgi:hypothetical protein
MAVAAAAESVAVSSRYLAVASRSYPPDQGLSPPRDGSYPYFGLNDSAFHSALQNPWHEHRTHRYPRFLPRLALGKKPRSIHRCAHRGNEMPGFPTMPHSIPYQEKDVGFPSHVSRSETTAYGGQGHPEKIKRKRKAVLGLHFVRTNLNITILFGENPQVVSPKTVAQGRLQAGHDGPAASAIVARSWRPDQAHAGGLRKT